MKLVKKAINNFLFAVGKISIVLVRFYMYVVYRPKAHFVDKSVQTNKLKEPCIVIANHTTIVDPPFILSILRGKTAIVIAKDWFEKPSINWICRAANGVPCDRFNLDTEWALLAKKELKKGRSVVIFPEGKCREDGDLNEFKSGFTFLARSTGYPVVSIGLDGKYSFGHRIHYVVDVPRKVERTKGVSSGVDLENQSAQFRERVKLLKRCALRHDLSSLPAPDTVYEVVPPLPEVTEETVQSSAQSTVDSTLAYKSPCDQAGV
ncbi:MAG: 1-acyl-sn-glycerol-3-phosphate acyltransferase [Treponema sp.]|nr:1-acyl-sn-glycerol-3-phosphate acyltransferase [Treponema sp.]